MQREVPRIIAIQLALAVFIMVICYPGFMSWDSIRMLQEARTSVIGGFAPTSPVYLLRMFDQNSFDNGPALMVFFENFLLLASMGVIGVLLGLRAKTSFVVTLIMLVSPTVIGCMLVLWKDVILTAFSIFGFAIIAASSLEEQHEPWNEAPMYIALAALLLGSLMRFNGILLVAPLLLFWVNTYFRAIIIPKRAVLLVCIAGFFVVTGNIVNSFRFPTFERLEKNPLLDAIMSYDLPGISYWARTPLLPPKVGLESGIQKASMEDIDAIYSSLGAEIMRTNNVRIGNRITILDGSTSEQVHKIWRQRVLQYPYAYLRYRIDLFREILGLMPHKLFEPTHFNKIDNNDFGIKFFDRGITTVVLSFIDTMSGIWIGKPWFLFLGAIASSLVILFKGPDPLPRKITVYSLLAAACYILPYFFISPTGEVRYAFPSLVFAFVPILALFGLILSDRRKGCTGALS